MSRARQPTGVRGGSVDHPDPHGDERPEHHAIQPHLANGADQPPADGSQAPRQQTKSMLKNQTKMRNHMVSENLHGMRVVLLWASRVTPPQIKGFCMDGMHCWPMKVFAITMTVVHVICCFSAFYVTASLYSSGLRSAMFYQGGGVVMIVMAAIGAGAAVVLALFFDFDEMRMTALVGPMMSLFVSMVLMGKRGILLGGFGGLSVGLPVGSLMESHEVGLSLGAIVGLLVGGILGICPFFSSLDMNQRYMNKQHEFGRLSVEDGWERDDNYS
ncbi:uncharacterized protein BcabD6B2_12140 [Babesia caballi]|uniref:Transmembrane protein, putative n=1 Tax=Babesia caballi TaxID=5871 RepID=A0AAV4LPD5_BABCB|nr:transmembrane protein, putative [Babesia caballi]